MIGSPDLAATRAVGEYTLLPAWGFVPAGKDQALKALTMAIIIQAARDARGAHDVRRDDARRWLVSNDCREMCEFVGLNYLSVCTWVRAGCPGWRVSSLKEDNQLPQ